MTQPHDLLSPSADGPQEPDRHLTTLPGWRAFIADEPVIPELLSDAERDALTPAARARYDEGRIDHHTRLLVVATSTVQHTVTCGRRLVLLNRHAVSARRGLIVSGPAGTGKTTAITQLGRSHELLDRARHPGVSDRIPVVYITVPPAATARMVAVEFARFLGLPVRPRSNITDVLESVCGVLTDARAGLVLVDELHNISLATRSGAEVADTLKYFSERIPATFVYAGINVEREGLFDGTRGQQIAGRFTLIPTAPLPYNTEWQGLVATLEDSLRLHDHKPGSLTDLDRYLHDRTGGMIGSLSHLIRGAALDAILTGSEKITRQSLKAIPLDHSSDS
ncbi:TniB family NTP-binding protein (plasmid) [Streptomyces sp. NBC_01450]|uniref:ATP-binding protein n=1 Tax=Streptomyces sp. NBC_01450 TaxID=2903871 RepID=UPI002E37A5A8|nr:ATP-binding protein [Streptomyces sp. NBC_01450]